MLEITRNIFLEKPEKVFAASAMSTCMTLDFALSDDTIENMKNIDVSMVDKRKIYNSIDWSLSFHKPSNYFETLRTLGYLHECYPFYPYLNNLIGLKQNEIYHPEGDVWNHTMMVIDNASKIKDESSNPTGFMYAALFHDIGKMYTTKFDEDKQKWISHNHAEAGAEKVANILKEMGKNEVLLNYVTNMIEMHMRPIQIDIKTSNKQIFKMDYTTVHDQDVSRFEVIETSEIAYLQYEVKDGVLDILHIYVPSGLDTSTPSKCSLM